MNFAIFSQCLSTKQCKKQTLENEIFVKKTFLKKKERNYHSDLEFIFKKGILENKLKYLSFQI